MFTVIFTAFCALLDAVFGLVFFITSCWMFLHGNYPGSIAAILIGTNCEWGAMRGLKRLKELT